MKLYEELARAIAARLNCTRQDAHLPPSLDAEGVKWITKRTMRIVELAEEYLPHGSGVDNGATVDLDRSTGDRIVLLTGFHHMTEHGFYDGWTHHSVIVKPSFIGDMTVTVTGRDRNGIKEHIAETFRDALAKEVE